MSSSMLQLSPLFVLFGIALAHPIGIEDIIDDDNNDIKQKGPAMGSDSSLGPVNLGGLSGVLTKGLGNMFGTNKTKSRQSGGGLFKGGPTGPPSALGPRPTEDPLKESVLEAIEGNMPTDTAVKNGKIQISVMSTQVVSGVVNGFMHNENLQPGEKLCLDQNLGKFTGGIVGVIKDAVKAVKVFIKPPAPPPVIPGQPPQRPPTKRGMIMNAGVDAAMKLGNLVSSASSLFKGCVHGDALRMLNKTIDHLIDVKYIGNRLLASGVDLAHWLADAIVNFESANFTGFGKDIGLTLRKVLLSKSTLQSSLPEGIPQEAIIRKTTEGMMDGFFGLGSRMEIKDAADPNVDIVLDLHSCIAENSGFFKEIWLALWNVFAQLSLAIKTKTPLGQPILSPGSSTKWTGELMIAVMQIPAVLERCNLDQDTEQMIGEAIESLPQLQVKLALPVDNIRTKALAERVAGAVSAWTSWDFRTFGVKLGMLVREFLLMLFPKKYSVDATGRLRRQLMSAQSAWTGAHLTGRKGLIALVAMGAMLVSFVTMRYMGVMLRRPAACEGDVEDPIFDDAGAE